MLFAQQMRANHAFGCLTDLCEKSNVRHVGVWFKHRGVTVFVLARYNTHREEDCRERLAVDEIRSRKLAGSASTAARGSTSFWL